LERARPANSPTTTSKGSIARATNAGITISNRTAVSKSSKNITDILTKIPVSHIQPVPDEWMNIRMHNDQPVEELILSIQKYGLIEPVILRKINDSQFQLLSGYRRLQAVKEMGMEYISSRVIEGLEDKDAREIFHDLHEKVIRNINSIQNDKRNVISTITSGMPVYLL
jgi:hypothetical protein